MATKRTTPAVTEQAEASVADPTAQQVVNAGIDRVMEATGVVVQKARYKAMRAIAFQAFANAVKDGTFDALVAEAIANADRLPSGWELGRTAKAEPAPNPTARRKATKAARA